MALRRYRVTASLSRTRRSRAPRRLGRRQPADHRTAGVVSMQVHADALGTDLHVGRPRASQLAFGSRIRGHASHVAARLSKETRAPIRAAPLRVARRESVVVSGADRRTFRGRDQRFTVGVEPLARGASSLGANARRRLSGPGGDNGNARSPTRTTAYSARNAATALWVCRGRSICGTCPQSSSM
jgi:hypothetical protein